MRRERVAVCRNGACGRLFVSASGKLRNLLYERFECRDPRFVRSYRDCVAGSVFDVRPVAFLSVRPWLVDFRGWGCARKYERRSQF